VQVAYEVRYAAKQHSVDEVSALKVQKHLSVNRFSISNKLLSWTGDHMTHTDAITAAAGAISINMDSVIWLPGKSMILVGIMTMKRTPFQFNILATTTSIEPAMQHTM